jgi:hypothetical protein
MRDEFQRLNDDLTAFETELRGLQPRRTKARLPECREGQVIANSLAPHFIDPVLKLFSSPVALVAIAIVWGSGVAFGLIASHLSIPGKISPSVTDRSGPITDFSINQKGFQNLPQTNIEASQGFDAHNDVRVLAERENANHSGDYALQTRMPGSVPWPLAGMLYPRKLSDLAIMPNGVNESHRALLDESDEARLSNTVSKLKIQKFVPVTAKTQGQVRQDLFLSLSLVD